MCIPFRNGRKTTFSFFEETQCVTGTQSGDNLAADFIEELDKAKPKGATKETAPAKRPCTCGHNGKRRGPHHNSCGVHKCDAAPVSCSAPVADRHLASQRQTTIAEFVKQAQTPLKQVIDSVATPSTKPSQVLTSHQQNTPLLTPKPFDLALTVYDLDAHPDAPLKIDPETAEALAQHGLKEAECRDGKAQQEHREMTALLSSKAVAPDWDSWVEGVGMTTCEMANLLPLLKAQIEGVKARRPFRLWDPLEFEYFVLRGRQVHVSGFNILAVVWYSGHFVLFVYDAYCLTLKYYDSVEFFCPERRAAYLENFAQFLEKQNQKKPHVISSARAAQQPRGSQLCGFYCLNNICAWFGLQGTFSRKDVLEIAASNSLENVSFFQSPPLDKRREEIVLSYAECRKCGGSEAILLTSASEKNKGRKFYRCASATCRQFMKWHDEE